MSEFLSKEMWWKGPKFIAQTDVELPTPPVLNCSREIELEQLNKVPDVTHTLVVSAEVTCKLGEEINYKLYSSLGKLLHVTAYVLRFVHKLRKCDAFKTSSGIELN